jgi:ADP-ribose pyrophosphatase YjhB (NUDIX family)
MAEPAAGRPSRNAHCSYCGELFPPGLPWPRRCAGCDQISYLNPVPVSVLLVPVDDGLLLVRRAIPPRAGLLALPGGYIGMGESWQEAGARELWEETGVRVDPGEIQLFDVRSAPDGTVLIFGLAKAHRAGDLPAFVRTDETSELVVASGPTELAFPLHSLVAGRFWAWREPGEDGG